MGVVGDFVFRQLVRQADEHGVVVWYDALRFYEQIAAELKIPDGRVARYEGSFYALRREVDALLDGEEAPRLVVYVPLEREATDNALVELESCGVVLRPGEASSLRNTRPSIVVRKALQPLLGESGAESVAAQVESGKLTLADAEKLAEQSEGIAESSLAMLLFATSDPIKVALRFLADPELDAEIEKKAALAELIGLFEAGLEAKLSAADGVGKARARLARHVLTTDFLGSWKEEAPEEFRSLRGATRPGARRNCRQLAEEWRRRRDLVESYVESADRIEGELGLTPDKIPGRAIADGETFHVQEQALQRRIAAGLLEAADAEAIQTAERRQSGFWSEQRPEVQARWALLATAGRLLAEADRVEKELRAAPTTAGEFIERYATAEQPWRLLDTFHRRLERRYHDFDFPGDAADEVLEKLIVKARERYMQVGAGLAEAFLERFEKARFSVSGVPHQTEIFERWVKPRLAEGKTAYILVDALRYEMACELVEALGGDGDVEIQPALAAIPTVTEIGMGALAAAKAGPARLVLSGGKPHPEFEGVKLKDRKSRIEYIRERAGVPFVAAKLEALLPKPRKRLADQIREADLIVLTSQEIDMLCEADNVHLARRTMDDILNELRRAVRQLAELGVKHVVAAADHGYLFGDELGVEMKLDPPGGETISLHRRVWVGRGGAAHPSYLRAKLSDFGYDSDWEIAAPRGFGCFKVKGGAKAYFHGGLSPQELIVPLITLRPTAKAEPSRGQIEWTLTPGGPKLTTRFFSVRIQGKATGLFPGEAPRIRVEVRARGETVSKPVSASYGFDEAAGDVQLRWSERNKSEIEENTITAMLLDDGKLPQTVSVRLADAETGRDLATPLKMEVAIAF